VVVDGHYFSNVNVAMVDKIIEETRAGLDDAEVRSDLPPFVLAVSCPRCNHSLMDPSHLIDGTPSVRVTASSGRTHGWARLSAVYGRYTVEAEHDVRKDTVVDFFCPHCHAALKGASACPLCGIAMVPMLVRAGVVVQICPRRGCKGHMLDLG
jgi:hypothetical protein